VQLPNDYLPNVICILQIFSVIVEDRRMTLLKICNNIDVIFWVAYIYWNWMQ